MNISKTGLALGAAGALVIAAFAGAGGAVAGGLITGADIKDKSITKIDLAGGSVNSGKIVDGSVQAVDLAAGVGGVVKVTKSASWSGGRPASFDLSCPAGKTVLATGQYDGTALADAAAFSFGVASAGNVSWRDGSLAFDNDDESWPTGVDGITVKSSTAATVTAGILCG